MRDIRFRVRPIHGINRGKRIQVGFEVELSATAEDPDGELRPGSPLTQSLYRELRALTQQAFPELPDTCRLEFLPYRGAVYFGAASRVVPRVAAKVQILHGRRYFREVDDDQLTVLEEIKEALKGMGFREG